MSADSILKNLKWIGLVVLSIVAAIVVAILRPRSPLPPKGGEAIPPPPRPLQDAVDRAEEAALVAKVKAKVEADNTTEALTEISKIDNGAERRKALAALLKKK